MSLIAASLMKSAVVGLTPSAEFTPVFSPTDWASAGVASKTSANAEARYFMVGFLSFESLQIRSLSIGNVLDGSSPAGGGKKAGNPWQTGRFVGSPAPKS